MGTASQTLIYGDEGVLCCIHKKMDGHPKTHGKELYNFLKNIKIGNGDELFEDAGDAGCLAAQLISHLKKEVGEVYLSMHTRDVDYEYSILVQEKKPFRIAVRLFGETKMIFDGNLKQFGEFIKK